MRVCLSLLDHIVKSKAGDLHIQNLRQITDYIAVFNLQSDRGYGLPKKEEDLSIKIA